MATHSSILAWGISWTEEPGGLQSTESDKELDTTEMTLVCILWLRATLSSLRFFLFFFITESLAALFVPLASSPNDCLGWRP